MKRIFALFLSLAVLFSCLAVTAGAMFDPSPVYEVQAKSGLPLVFYIIILFLYYFMGMISQKTHRLLVESATSLW